MVRDTKSNENKFIIKLNFKAGGICIYNLSDVIISKHCLKFIKTSFAPEISIAQQVYAV